MHEMWHEMSIDETGAERGSSVEDRWSAGQRGAVGDSGGTGSGSPSRLSLTRKPVEDEKPTEVRVKRLIVVVAISLGILWSPSAWAARDPMCQDENGQTIPCEKDGGGGLALPGPPCSHPTCWGCGAEQSGGYRPCVPYAGLACNCLYDDNGGKNPDHKCYPYGPCTFTGP